MKKVIRSIRGGDSAADDAKSAVEDARRSFRSTARSTARDVRKGARSQYVRARVAAARATAPRRTRTDGKKVAAAGAVGAVGAFLLDPQGGARRRNVAKDKVLSLLKSRARPEKSAPNDQALTPADAGHSAQ